MTREIITQAIIKSVEWLDQSSQIQIKYQSLKATLINFCQDNHQDNSALIKTLDPDTPT